MGFRQEIKRSTLADANEARDWRGHAASGKRPYPSDLGELLRDHRFPGIRRHLRKAYYDPLTGKSEWGVAEAPEGGIMGVYSLATETPIKLTGFPEQFSQLEGKTKYTDWIFGYPPIDLSRHQLLPRTPQ